MSNSHWREYITPGRTALGVVLIVLVTVCGWLLCEYRDRHREERARAAEAVASDGFEQRPITCMHVPLLGAYSCSVRFEHPEDADDYARYDLRAQQDMAKWGYGVFLTSIGTVFLSLVGVVLLFVTLQQTHETLKQAKAQTDLAKRAGDAQERLSSQSLAAVVATMQAAQRLASVDRAWINVDFIGSAPIERDAVPVWYNKRVAFSVRNVGRSPATIQGVLLRVYWHPGLSAWGQRNSDPISNNTGEVSGSVTWFADRDTQNVWPVQDERAVEFREDGEVILDAQSQRTLEGVLRFLNDDLDPADEMDRAHLNLSSFFFHCVVRYDDIHGIAHETEYYRKFRNAGGPERLPEPLHSKYNRHT